MSIPSTVERSAPKARRTWKETRDSAVRQYGEGSRAHRTALAALKHSFETRGDRWVAKDGRGPSDSRAKKSGRAARRDEGETFGGVDFEGSTKAELYERAKSLDVPGRSAMSKKELARAVARRQRSRSTAEPDASVPQERGLK